MSFYCCCCRFLICPFNCASYVQIIKDCSEFSEQWILWSKITSKPKSALETMSGNHVVTIMAIFSLRIGQKPSQNHLRQQQQPQHFYHNQCATMLSSKTAIKLFFMALCNNIIVTVITVNSIIINSCKDIAIKITVIFTFTFITARN